MKVPQAYLDLDNILKELWSPLTYSALLNAIPKKYSEITKERLEKGIEKLREDGMVYVVNKPYYVYNSEIENGWYVRLSYNGEMLISDGGYATKYCRDYRRRKGEIRRQWWMVVGTLVAGLGAISLVIWEIYKTFFLHK